MSVAVTIPTSLIQQRKAFHSANKDSNETVDEWYHRLQDLALSCDYGPHLEMLLLDKLVVGLDDMILDRLCMEQTDLSLKDVIDFSWNYEMNSDHNEIKPEMIIVKQELELTDDDSQSNVYANYADEYSQVNEDFPLQAEAFVNTPSLVYDRPKVFECYLCHKCWPTVGHLTYHFARHHTGGTVSKCHLCGKWLKTPSSLVRHVNMHLSDRPYHCDQCDFSFASAISLKRHMVQHNQSESNAFKCSQCQKEFLSQRHLRLHRKTHVGHPESDDTKANINFTMTQSIDYSDPASTSFTPKYEIDESNYNPSFDESLSIYSSSHTRAKRRPKIKRTWKFERKFSSHSDAINFVNYENLWSTSTTNTTTQGKKVLYRCRKAKLKGQQCEAGVSLLFCRGIDEILLHRAENPHTCQINCLPSPRNPMSVQLRDTITRIFRDGRRKRKEIEEQLIAEGYDMPPSTQFNVLIRNLQCEYIRKN